MNIEHFIASFIVGLLGAGHCIGMCGGISAALTFSIDQSSFARRLQIIFAYNFGRVACYTFMGAIVAILGIASEQLGFRYMRVIAGVLMILMAFYISGVWKVLTLLEQLGKKLWQILQPFGTRLMPVKSAYSAMLLGAIWGWLPCGLVYTALALSATTANIGDGALSMLAFGLGTLPAVVTGGIFADAIKKLIAGLWFRSLMAILMACFGVWTMYSVFAHQHHHNHGSHQDHQREQHLHHQHHH